MHEIDASFRLRKEQASAKRSRARKRRLLASVASGVLVVFGAGFYFTYDKWSINLDEELEAVDYHLPETTEAEAPPVFVPAIVDLAGDPMIINIGRSGNTAKTRDLPRPEKLSDPGISATITFLSDAMLSSSERFMTTLPSTQEDFAFFQAQRSRSAEQMQVPDTAYETAPTPAVAPAAPGDAPAEQASVGSGVDDEAAGWGETISDGQADLPEFKKTRVENTTSVAYSLSELERFQPVEDFFVKVKSSRSLDGLVLEQGFGQEDAKVAGEALKAIMDMDLLSTGYVVALRGVKETARTPTFRLMQVSIYADETYLGTLARADDGTFGSGSDPWVNENLFDYSGDEAEAADQPAKQYRLLDAIYSTAARNNVPTGVIGEAIMLLSRSQDLSGFASPDEKFQLIFSHDARDGNLGRVLFVGVTGKDRNFECYVYRPASGGDFTCMTEDNLSVSVTMMNGMVTPVSGGTLGSRFGMRKHPILGVVREHKGVDWAAPTGSPVMAAYDGKIAYVGDGKGYGNIIRISHPGGRETRYAHLSKFAGTAKPGVDVKAGDVIGYVGTTGLSTGPHLHFELYLAGKAINPIGETFAAVRSDDAAVEKLVDRIISVESGGNAKAKNPTSSATGLGQFIDGTWLRMMRTYRPDLSSSLSRADQLALRFDPDMSREMVRHLAQEGEAYLRSRGHAITAGRLYLCHFLGMEGAHVVLSASPDAPLINVLGAGVINANNFLTGKDVAHVIDWAERKMNRKAKSSAGGAPSVVTKKIERASPEFQKFKEAIGEVLVAMGDPNAGRPAQLDATTTEPSPGDTMAPTEDDGSEDEDSIDVDAEGVAVEDSLLLPSDPTPDHSSAASGVDGLLPPLEDAELGGDTLPD